MPLRLKKTRLSEDAFLRTDKWTTVRVVIKTRIILAVSYFPLYKWP